MADLEDLDLVRDVVALDKRVAGLEAALASAKRDRDDRLKVLHERLKAIGRRSTQCDGLLVTVRAEYRWQTSVAQGVAWALKHNHHDILTVLAREFSAKVQGFVAAGHAPPPWIKRWPVLSVIVRSAGEAPDARA